MMLGLGIKISYDHRIDEKIYRGSPQDILVYVDKVVCKFTTRPRSTSYIEFYYKGEAQRIYMRERECNKFERGIYLKVYHLEQYPDIFLYKKPGKNMYALWIFVGALGIACLINWYLKKIMGRKGWL